MLRIQSRMVPALAAAVLCLTLPSANVRAASQTGSKQTLTLAEAIQLAVRNYPAVRARLEQLRAARAGVALSRTSYLPRLDTLWQSNRGTRNNIFGPLLPQSVIPPISGPALPTTSGESAWGSAAGVLFSWEPFDFGYRRATVDAARSESERAGAEAEVTRLDVASAAADAFFSLVAADEEIKTAEADVHRRQIFRDSIRVLVQNQLRAGADASRADAELAGARIRLIRAQANQKEAQAALGETLGMAESEINADAGPLLEPPPDADLAPPPATAHPLVRTQKANEQEASARVRALSRSYVPRFSFQTAVSGRGSGANTDGSFADGLNGLGLERANWAAGLTISFPIFDFASLRAKKEIEVSHEREESARYDLAVQQVTAQVREARAALEGARQVAANTPVQLEAARTTEAEERARYQAGLATIVEVTDSQSLLAQAEIENSLARLGVWRALARLAAAEGNVQPFMKILEEKSSKGH